MTIAVVQLGTQFYIGNCIARRSNTSISYGFKNYYRYFYIFAINEYSLIRLARRNSLEYWQVNQYLLYLFRSDYYISFIYFIGIVKITILFLKLNYDHRQRSV